ncbi:SRPBCC family protein [Diaminobutyricibacter sp. McL0618]|uniref:SRPBCC family protein n=1 Tax=Leifsonia sp. McL0618 TaxID=3415677 RepID=UPI003CF8C83C
MELDTGFSVVAPIDTVWKVLLDFDRVAASVPGAEILERPSDDTLKVGMKVKLGPVSMQYKGTVNVLELDEAQHRAVFGGKAQETRGQGTAEGTATMQLTQDGETIVGTVHAELNLSGRAAAMGKSIINSVTQQMVELFASNLQKMVEEELSGGSGAAGVPAAEATPAAEVTPAAEAATSVAPPATEAADASTADTPTPPTHPAPPRPPAPAENSLNALSLARGVIVDQLQNPAKLAVALLAVGFIGFLIGRGRRRRV